MWALITVLQSIRDNRELAGGVVWKAISDHWHTNMCDYIWWGSRLFLWKWAHPRLQTVNLHYIYLNHFISDQLARLNPQERLVQRKQTCRVAYFTPTWGTAFWYSPSVMNRRQEAAMVTCDVWGDVSSMTRIYISHYVRPGWHPHRCKRCVRWNLPMCDLWKTCDQIWKLPTKRWPGATGQKRERLHLFWNRHGSFKPVMITHIVLGGKKRKEIAFLFPLHLDWTTPPVIFL